MGSSQVQGDKSEGFHWLSTLTHADPGEGYVFSIDGDPEQWKRAVQSLDEGVYYVKVRTRTENASSIEVVPYAPMVWRQESGTKR